jgi:RND family efflux transporter MFP subunit
LANVAVQEIQSRSHTESLILPARLEANRSAQISSELSGRLERWLVEEGSVVEEGQILAELNDADLRAKLAELEVQGDIVRKQIGLSEQDLAVARLSLEQARRDAEALELTRESSQADLEFARKESERVTVLAQSAIATQAEVDRVRNQLTQAELALAKAKDAMERAAVAVRTAEARVAQSEANVALTTARVQEIEQAKASLEVTLAKTKLHAPFAGRFDEYLVEAGEVVSPGQVLGRLYDSSTMRVAVDVPDRYAPFLETGNPLLEQYITQAMPGTRQEIRATVQIPGLPKLTGGRHAGIELPAKIVRVAQAASEISHTFRVELRFANPGGALREGMIVRAEIGYLAYDKAIVIPLSAIQVADVGPRALVVTEKDGKQIVQTRNIVPVSIRDDLVLVSSGLTEGERLIVSGGRGVLDGEEVRVVVSNGSVVDRDGNHVDSFIRLPEAEEENTGTAP